MKLSKRLAALVLTLAFAAMLLPSMAFATGSSPAGAEPAFSSFTGSYEIGTYREVSVDKADSSSTSASTTSGSGTKIEFTPAGASGSIAGYASGLAMRIYFNGAGYGDADKPIPFRMESGSAFEAQDSRAYVPAGEKYILVTNLKYAKVTDDDFIGSFRMGDTDNDWKTFSKINMGECAKYVPEAPSSSVPPESVPTPSPDPRAPGLIVKSSSIGTDAVNAGEEFTLSLTIYATASGTEDITDVVVSLAPEKGVVITSGGSTQYIGSMKPGSSQTVSFPMQAQADFTDGVSTVAVTLSGTGAVTGSAAAATGTTISVPVNQPDRFEISKVEVPESLVVGEENMATITFVNKGKNPVNNLTFQLDATNNNPASQNQYVGNLAGGTEDSVDLDLNPLEEGALTGTITITYEAASGQVVTLTQDISSTVEAGYDMSYDDSMMQDAMGDVVEEPAGLPTVAIVLIAVAAVVVVIVVVVVVRKRRAKKKALLEAEDEDL